jgi:hypothetical protein
LPSQFTKHVLLRYSWRFAVQQSVISVSRLLTFPLPPQFIAAFCAIGDSKNGSSRKAGMPIADETVT